MKTKWKFAYTFKIDNYINKNSSPRVPDDCGDCVALYLSDRHEVSCDSCGKAYYQCTAVTSIFLCLIWKCRPYQLLPAPKSHDSKANTNKIPNQKKNPSGSRL